MAYSFNRFLSTGKIYDYASAPRVRHFRESDHRLSRVAAASKLHKLHALHKKYLQVTLGKDAFLPSRVKKAGRRAKDLVNQRFRHYKEKGI